MTEDGLYDILGEDTPASTITALESAIASYTSAGVYSSNADKKTLHELYLWPWADAVSAGAVSTMCASKWSPEFSSLIMF
jgi:hypothetical protein